MSTDKEGESCPPLYNKPSAKAALVVFVVVLTVIYMLIK